MRIQQTLAALCSLFVAQWLTLAAFAVEVTEPAGAAHGYPGLCDINGKKLADSEFRQWVENTSRGILASGRAVHASDDVCFHIEQCGEADA
jgi:hypothetical protein